jgi:hypothetical protein
MSVTLLSVHGKIIVISPRVTVIFTPTINKKKIVEDKYIQTDSWTLHIFFVRFPNVFAICIHT